MVDLNSRFDPKLSWELDSATALNDLGQIVGNGTHLGKARAFRLTPLHARGGMRETRPADVSPRLDGRRLSR